MDQKLFVPGAIIVAGLIIAGAVFYGGSDSTDPADNGGENNGDIVLEDVTEDDHILGNPNAQLLIVEYSDIDCPFCQTFHNTMHDILDEYGPSGDVAWVYRHFPLAQLHPLAPAKAEASECVAELGGNDAFWTFLDTLFEREGETLGELGGIAAVSGVDETAFNECLESDRHVEKIQAMAADAQRAGGTGTPYSVIVARTGQIVPINGAQPYENVKQVIDALLGEQE